MRLNLGIVDLRVYCDDYQYTLSRYGLIEKYMWIDIRFDNGELVRIQQARQR